MINNLKNMNILVRIPFLLFFWVLCVIGFVIIAISSLISVVLGNADVWNVVVATDRLLNSSWGGDNKETLSSRAYRGTLKDITGWCYLCKILDKMQKDHCKKSVGI